jgi:hypothetical protein
VRNALGVPYAWLLRPRNFVYAWLVFAFLVPAWPMEGWTDGFIWGCNAVLAVKVMTGFYHIRSRL